MSELEDFTLFMAEFIRQLGSGKRMFPRNALLKAMRSDDDFKELQERHRCRIADAGLVQSPLVEVNREKGLCMLTAVGEELRDSATAETTEGESDEQPSSADVVREALDTLRKQLGMLATQAERTVHAEQHVETLTAELADHKRELGELRQELVGAKRDRAAAEQRIAALEEELREVRAAAESVPQLTDKVSALEQSLEQARAEAKAEKRERIAANTSRAGKERSLAAAIARETALKQQLKAANGATRAAEQRAAELKEQPPTLDAAVPVVRAALIAAARDEPALQALLTELGFGE